MTTYYYESKVDGRMNFSLETPRPGMGKEPYSLVFDKEGFRQEPENSDGYISLAAHKIIFNGMINYYRVSEIDSDNKKVYESLDNYAYAEFQLDNSNILIHSLNIKPSMTKCSYPTAVITTYNDHYKIMEKCTPTGLKRIANFEKEGSPDIIKQYKTEGTNNIIYFKDRLLIQETTWPDGSNNHVTLAARPAEEFRMNFLKAVKTAMLPWNKQPSGTRSLTKTWDGKVYFFESDYGVPKYFVFGTKRK